jgi:hypothetical protein
MFSNVHNMFEIIEHHNDKEIYLGLCSVWDEKKWVGYGPNNPDSCRKIYVEFVIFLCLRRSRHRLTFGISF